MFDEPEQIFIDFMHSILSFVSFIVGLMVLCRLYERHINKKKPGAIKRGSIARDSPAKSNESSEAFNLYFSHSLAFELATDKQLEH